MSFRVLAEQFARSIEMGVFADAGKNIERLPAVRTGILHTVCSDNLQPVIFRQIRELPIDPVFTAEEVPLDLDKDILAPEEVDKKLRAFRRILGSAGALARPLPERLAECVTNV